MVCAPAWVGAPSDGGDGIVDGPHDVAKFSYPVGLAFSLDRKTLYVADWGNSAIRAINVATRITSTVATGLDHPDHLAVHPISGDIYTWTGPNGVGDHTITRVTPGGSVTNISGLSFRQAHGLDFSPDGAYLYVSYATNFFGTDGNSRIRKVRLSDQANMWDTQYANLFSDNSCVQASPENDVVYASYGDFNGKIRTLDAATGVLDPNPALSFDAQDGNIGFSVFGGRIVLGNCRLSHLWIWDRHTGAFKRAVRVTQFTSVGVPVWRDRQTIFVCDSPLETDHNGTGAGYMAERSACHVIRIVRFSGWSAGYLRIG